MFNKSLKRSSISIGVYRGWGEGERVTSGVESAGVGEVEGSTAAGLGRHSGVPTS